MDNFEDGQQQQQQQKLELKIKHTKKRKKNKLGNFIRMIIRKLIKYVRYGQLNWQEGNRIELVRSFHVISCCHFQILIGHIITA